jgi:hypothetical protein
LIAGKGKRMKSHVFRSLILIQTILLASMTVEASTAFMAAKGKKVLTGRNGDSGNLNIRMRVLPASEGKYGRIYLGAEGGQGIGTFYNTTGMNDQGLWYGATSLYDGEALPVRNDIKNYYNKPTLNVDLVQRVMEVCSTVDEVIEYFTRYYYPVWNGHDLFVDRNGNSVIIEFGEKDVVFVRRNGDHQVMTNFPNADTLNARWYNCYRYKTADCMLSESQDMSTDFFRSVCDAVHLRGKNPTSLSTVYDVITGDLYVYYFHNYEEVLVFNVYDELAKGEKYYVLPDFFRQTRANYPTRGESVSPSSVTFSWSGNAQGYDLYYYSTDLNFMGARPATTSASVTPARSSAACSILCIGVLVLGLGSQRGKRVFVFLIGVVMISAFASCTLETVVESPFAPSLIEHHLTVKNLQPNTQYYWKVVAQEPGDVRSQSSVQTFRTTG